ncbi:VanW family protein [Patescibacteria group bacterium]
MLKKILLSISVIITCGMPTGYLLASGSSDMLILKIDGQQDITIYSEEINNWINYNPELQYNKNYHSSVENTEYCPENIIICNLSKRIIDGLHIQKVDKVNIDKKKIELFLEDLASKVNQDPIDATFTITGSRVSAFSTEKEGMQLNVKKSAEAIYSKLQDNYTSTPTINLTIEKISPEVTSKDVNKLGVETLIGEGKSNFYGSTSSRIHNIAVATSRFDGLLIKPGEEFSFIENLGPVDGESGYKQELVIKKDKTELDYGGGVCQVSTTAFRAAIYSGLEITARRNHAYAVSYYNPQGMDATVYIPRPDLKFINNTPGYILIQTEINIPKRELIFRFYGTDIERKTEVDGPYITSREPDGSMKATFTQIVYDKDSNVIIKDIFNSSYDSPNNYPHPGDEKKLTKKPKDWSNKQWKDYRRANGI